MKIYCVTDEFYTATRSFFRGHDVNILPINSSGLEADLIIFQGGPDVHPSYYGGNIHGNWYDKERDEYEMKVMDAISKEIIHTKKVMGICRGLQLLNVAFGGSLIEDIQSYFGREHSSHHPISWASKNIFSFLTEVNSIHHQAISGVGDSHRYTVLGYEPTTRLVEAIIWSDKYLAVQFHPELWRNSEESEKMSDALEEWVEGRIGISGIKIARRGEI